MRIALMKAGLLVGTVLPAESLPRSGSIGECDYLFLGLAGDRTRLFDSALRDCARSGWLVAEPQSCRRARATALNSSRHRDQPISHGDGVKTEALNDVRPSAA
jgi:hypothetical protein